MFQAKCTKIDTKLAKLDGLFLYLAKVQERKNELFKVSVIISLHLSVTARILLFQIYYLLTTRLTIR